jgi:hypothetical protein
LLELAGTQIFAVMSGPTSSSCIEAVQRSHSAARAVLPRRQKRSVETNRMEASVEWVS